MLDVGFSEILLTSAIALIVLGPERLPKVARQVGNWMGRARAMARQLSEQLEREVSAEELLKTQSKPSPSANLPSGGTDSPSGGTDSPSSGAASPGSGTSGAAFDPAYTPSIAPAPAPPPARAPEPVYGLDAASTTAAAMHANDPPVAVPVPPAADPTPAATHTRATDAKSPHE
jgi:sec-independent protein translocase protein TatB